MITIPHEALFRLFLILLLPHTTLSYGMSINTTHATRDNITMDTFIKIKNKMDQQLSSLRNGGNESLPLSKFFRFRGIHSFLNDVEYQKLDELPIDGTIKRQLEDFIINPRRNDDEFKF